MQIPSLSAQWPDRVPKARYGGDGLDWSIRRLATTDRRALQDFYDAMLKLLATQIGFGDNTQNHIHTLTTWMVAVNWQSLRRDVAAIGPDTYAEFGTNPTLRKVFHDLRGGPMTSLSIDLGLVRAGRGDTVDPQRVYLLVRDVCKIMRNSFPDLDEDRYTADTQIKAHSVGLLVDKWRRIQHEHPLEVVTDFEGAVAETCIEFSALDRVLYNVINNALREAAGDNAAVTLGIFKEPSVPPRHVRFVISNPVAAQHADRLTQRFDGDLAALFTDDFSTTGSGIGLKVVSDFVSRTYDTTVLRVLEAGYLGAMLADGRFTLWFHWPVVDMGA